MAGWTELLAISLKSCYLSTDRCRPDLAHGKGVTMEKNQNSMFTGGLAGLIGVNLLSAIISVCTLGLCVPWGVCIKERWIARHTYIDGRQLVFDGTGGQLMGNYIKWFLLTLVALGIYAFWLDIKLKQWVVKHTHFA